MIPLMFGPATRRKYGVFQAALGHGSKGRGLVICDGLFDEALCAHRALGFATGKLAGARWNSLRFDYFGTGDSAGETADFSLARARVDIADAIDELKACAGLEQLYLLGLRLGGSLALEVAVERDDIRGLVLWDPILSGERVLDRYRVPPADESDGPGDALEGFRLPRRARDELRTLSIGEPLAQWDRPLLMVCSAPTRRHRRIAADHPRIDYREIEAPEAWSNTALGGVRPIPTAVIDAIHAWPG